MAFPAHSNGGSLSQRLPGPAGKLSVRPACSAQTIGTSDGDGGGGGVAEKRKAGDPDFLSRPWLQALRDVDAGEFDANREPFVGNTVRAAINLQQSGVVDRLLAVVVALKRCHSGEAFIRLKDPTGMIGGTLTRAVVEGEPGIQQGAVLVLRRVTVMRTPPPRSLSHLCILLDSVLQVIMPAAAPADGLLATGAQLSHLLPALPPRQLQPAASWQQPQQQQPLAHPAHQPPAPSSSCAWPSLAHPASGMPPRPGPHPMQHARLPQQQQPHTSNGAWPSIGTVPREAMPQQPQQQHLQQPGARLPPRAAGPIGAPQQQQAPAVSESVNFSMPSVSVPAQQGHQACQDDASSLPARPVPGEDPPCTRHVHKRGKPSSSQHEIGAPAAGWLNGLLAEANFDPFALRMASQQFGSDCRREALAERQPNVVVTEQAGKRHCTTLIPPPPAAYHQGQPFDAAYGGAVFDAVDELDLDE